jgi:hypothetical protein
VGCSSPYTSSSILSIENLFFFHSLVVKVSRIKGLASFAERIVLPASHQNESFPKSKTKAK